jgi:hypothetical protein
MYLPYDISKRILGFRGAYMLRDKIQAKIVLEKSVRRAIYALSVCHDYVDQIDDWEEYGQLDPVFYQIYKLLHRGLANNPKGVWIDYPKCKSE